MKFWLRVGDRTFEAVVEETAGQVVVLVDGQAMQAELEEGAPGIYSLLLDGKPYDLAVTPRAGGYGLAVRGVPFDVEVQDERQRRISSVRGAKAAAEGKLSIRAPMPGRVARVEVDEGDRVERGTRLVVLEAMKMENDIAAPRAGRVGQVKVKRGQTVEQGQLLVVLE